MLLDNKIKPITEGWRSLSERVTTALRCS